MNLVWLVCRVEDGWLDAGTQCLISHAARLSDTKACSFTLICFGEIPKSVPKGFEKVLCLESPAWEGPDSQGRRLAELISRDCPDIILAASNRWERTIMAVAAAISCTGLTADCTKLQIGPDDLLVQERPAFGGELLAQIVTPDARPVMATVRCAEVLDHQVEMTVPQGVYIPGTPVRGSSRILDILQVVSAEKDDPAEHSAVLAAGMGVGSREGFDFLRDLAHTLGMGFAATRAAVNAGFASYSSQVGQSGKVIAPEIYIAVGISGAAQHLAGVHRAGRIVAVNTDPIAPIFDHADDAVVCDWKAFADALHRETVKSNASFH